MKQKSCLRPFHNMQKDNSYTMQNRKNPEKIKVYSIQQSNSFLPFALGSLVNSCPLDLIACGIHDLHATLTMFCSEECFLLLQ